MGPLTGPPCMREDEGGLSPVKADNEVWRDLCHWESEISIGY